MPYFFRYFISIAFTLVVGFSSVSAQDKKLISGDFQGMNFEQFAKSIESKTDFHFYYNISQFDSFTVNLSVNNKTLNAVLDEVFLHTDFHYSIDPENNVFVIRRYKIDTKLPQDFFSRKKIRNDTSGTF